MNLSGIIANYESELENVNCGIEIYNEECPEESEEYFLLHSCKRLSEQIIKDLRMIEKYLISIDKK